MLESDASGVRDSGWVDKTKGICPPASTRQPAASESGIQVMPQVNHEYILKMNNVCSMNQSNPLSVVEGANMALFP